MYAYESLVEHKNQGSGVSDILLYAPIPAFATISGPTLTASPGTPVPGEEVTISTAHTFNTDEGFIQLLCAPFVNQLTAAASGETGSMKFNPRVEVFVPGSYDVLHEFAKKALNQSAILLVKDANCDADFYYQVGNKCVYAWMSEAEFGTATTKEGKKGWKFVWETAASGLLLYKATVTMKPAAGS